MAFKVLVVDDSAFFRRRVSEILRQDPRIEVVGEAKNGHEAIQQTARFNPDVVTMDVEMPVMDGIQAVRKIMQTNPVPVLMFSSLTHEGAQATLEALDAGAMDFLPKRFEEIALNKSEAAESFRQRVKALARRKGSVAKKAQQHGLASAAPAPNKPKIFLRASNLGPTSLPELASGKLAKGSGKLYRTLAIGASTGGPIALQNILRQLPANLPCPVFVVQHMPASFTGPFANRLNGLCQIEVKQAEDGEPVRRGVAYVAPGGKQMQIERSLRGPRIRILAGDKDNNPYKPCVDLTFNSLADIYKGDTLAVILTGMGADGRAGSQRLKQEGATIWAQDESTSVVYGMPQVVTVTGIASASYALMDMANNIKMELGSH